jgi:ABC-type transport system involved in multi-copper enzyme maturation permease subunit
MSVTDHLPDPGRGVAFPDLLDLPAASRSDGVILPVFRHELRRLAGGFRLYACGLLIVLLLVAAAVTAAARFGDEGREQEAIAQRYRAHISHATVEAMAEIPHPATKPPWRLALLVDGGQSATPDLYTQALSALVSPELVQTHSDNDRLLAPKPLDWIFVVSVVLSLAACLLGYDAVCGERRAGTLKLLLSYPMPRWKIFTGKLLAAWACLAGPFLASALVSLLVAVAWGGLRWNGEDIVKIGLVTLLALWAALLFVLAALLVSSLTRDPATSLSVLTLLWVTAVVVVPALGGLLAHRLQPIPSESEIGRRSAEIGAEVDREYRGREAQWRRPEWAAADGFAWERISAQAENRRWALRDELRRWVIDRKLAQARLAYNLSSVSPPALIQNIAERMTSCGLWRDRSFLAQARSFRDTLTTWLGGLDARDPRSPHILFFSGYLSRQPVDPASVPRFAFREAPVRQGLAAARLALALLTCQTALLAVAAFFSFSRYDAG